LGEIVEAISDEAGEKWHNAGDHVAAALNERGQITSRIRSSAWSNVNISKRGKVL
jgi:hypothetical protein